MKKKKLNITKKLYQEINTRDFLIITFKSFVYSLLIVSTLVGVIYSFSDDYYELKYAYLSYKSVCKPVQFENDNPMYVIAGTTSATIVNGIAENITVKLYTPDLSTQVHEQCHVLQFQRGENADCKHPIKFILSEFECYRLSFPVQIGLEEI